MKKVELVVLFVLAMLSLIGCGGNKSPKPTSGQELVDPSGNWKLSFVDANSNTFILSALFSQTGADVTALNFSEVGNGAANFQCATQTDVTLANGLVQNVNQFSGDVTGNFGVIHFTSNLNDPGTHAAGTYTLTPAAGGNCLGIALTGTYTGDEVPSMSGTWTGTVACTSNCPAATPAGTSGSIMVTLSQNDTTGVVSGTYSISGLLPLLSSGAISTTASNSDLLSGASWQDTMNDNSGSVFAIAGGPLSSNGTAGLAQDSSFRGVLVMRSCCSNTTYSVTMTH